MTPFYFQYNLSSSKKKDNYMLHKKLLTNFLLTFVVIEQIVCTSNKRKIISCSRKSFLEKNAIFIFFEAKGKKRLHTSEKAPY